MKNEVMQLRSAEKRPLLGCEVGKDNAKEQELGVRSAEKCWMPSSLDPRECLTG